MSGRTLTLVLLRLGMPGGGWLISWKIPLFGMQNTNKRFIRGSMHQGYGCISKAPYLLRR